MLAEVNKYYIKNVRVVFNIQISNLLLRRMSKVWSDMIELYITKNVNLKGTKHRRSEPGYEPMKKIQ